MTPSDPLYAQQWHFALLGDIETIWDEFTGTGVHVGVWDDGIEVDHPDLAANYDPSLHFVHDGITYAPTPLTSADGHGTCTAGLIGAVAGNDAGGVGVAFGVTLTAVNTFDPATYATRAIEAASIRWAANFDIMSNSWGWSPGYRALQDIGDQGTNHFGYDKWYGEVSQTGRGGLGTIIVQAAGNDTKNANGDGLNASRYTITVAATDQAGNAQYYTNFGACILVAAPASAVTTDLSGNAGYNGAGDSDPAPRAYTTDFGGTSAATPTVAGIVALMLDANDGLGWRDVQNILAFSASETGSGYGNAGTGEEVGQWVTGTAGTWNGGGHAFHASYGYGMVDAFAAVRMAEAWGVLHPTAQTSANEQQISVHYFGGAVGIPDFGTAGPSAADAQVTVTQNLAIESVYVTVDITHAAGSDLILTLISPDGTEVTFFANEGKASLMSAGFEYTFGIDALRGYTSAGDWTLRVTDTNGGNVGVINGFDLQFFGGVACANDVHTITDDFLTLAGLEGGRSLLSDTNGGLDWLNMAAISGDIVANLNASGAVTVAGVAWFTLGPVVQFEHLYAGDGDDLITGNRLGNDIWAARGDDLLRGSAGDDRLNGGQGADRLVGGRGADAFVFDMGCGADKVRDFASTVDAVIFDQGLWGGGLSAAQVIGRFATLVAGGVVFDFGGGNVVTFAGVGAVDAFQDGMVLV